MTKKLLIALLLACVPAFSAWGNGYSYRATITVDHTKVPNSSQTAFPMLIAGTYSNLAHIDHSGKVTSVSGYDIAFTTDPAGGTLVYPEIESYNHETGAVVLWVAFDLSNTADTTIYCFYGNSSITASQYSASAVWDSNFVGVWHLSENITGSGQSVNDSSSGDALNGTTSGTWPATPSVSGKAGTALEFDGLSDGSMVEAAGASFSALDGQKLTVTAWVYPDGYPGGYNRIIDRGWGTQFCVQVNNGDMCLGVATTGTGLSYTTVLAAGVINTGSWQHVGYVFDGSYARAYLSGAATGTPVTATGDLVSATANIAVGGRPDGGSNRRWDGKLDEVRLSKVARSADWIATEYNNQSSPGTFYSTDAWNSEPASPTKRRAVML